jgi:hypothetical protein
MKRPFLFLPFYMFPGGGIENRAEGRHIGWSRSEIVAWPVFVWFALVALLLPGGTSCLLAAFDTNTCWPFFLRAFCSVLFCLVLALGPL